MTDPVELVYDALKRGETVTLCHDEAARYARIGKDEDTVYPYVPLLDMDNVQIMEWRQVEKFRYAVFKEADKSDQVNNRAINQYIFKLKNGKYSWIDVTYQPKPLVDRQIKDYQQIAYFRKGEVYAVPQDGDWAVCLKPDAGNRYYWNVDVYTSVCKQNCLELGQRYTFKAVFEKHHEDELPDAEPEARPDPYRYPLTRWQRREVEPTTGHFMGYRQVRDGEWNSMWDEDGDGGSVFRVKQEYTVALMVTHARKNPVRVLVEDVEDVEE